MCFIHFAGCVLSCGALHLALFYLFGTYLYVSKRSAGVRYVFLRRGGPELERPSYAILGLLLLIQLTITAVRAARQHFRDRRRARELARAEADAAAAAAGGGGGGGGADGQSAASAGADRYVCVAFVVGWFVEYL